jgi:hypothetical protein
MSIRGAGSEASNSGSGHNVILGPLPTLIIWQSHQDKCKALNDAMGGLGALAAITAVKVKSLDDKAKIAIVIAIYILNVIKNRYC